MVSPIRVAVLKGSWPVPSESPSCLKLLTWLRMAGIDHEVEPLTGRPKSKTGKAPYITRPNGTIVDDSSVIIEALTAECGVVLDRDRSAQERAAMLTIQRTVECHLYFAGLLHRWRDNWKQTRDAYFGGKVPGVVLAVLAPFLRRSALAQAHGQGMGRRPPQEVVADALADLAALRTMLGDDEYFFGSPGVTDAIVYGQLENLRAAPLPGPLQEAVVSDPGWVAYLDRIGARYWS